MLEIVSHKKAQSINLNKLKTYLEFSKFRLASLVVISAVLTFLFAVGTQKIEWTFEQLIWLILGGFFVTAGSNGLNQVIEIDLDKKMDRTKDRPLPSGRMTVNEGLIVSGILGFVGVVILWKGMNFLSGILGLFALVSYALIYTPLKRKTPFAVFVGAFPGAIPPVIGWTAATGEMKNPVLWMLFAIQFVWQFPHFWAIAWKMHEDYQKAGFHLLPSRGGKDKSSAYQILVYSVFLIPVSTLVYLFDFYSSNINLVHGYSLIVVIGLGIWFAGKAIKLFKTLEDKDATKLMFASFIYLPLVQIAMLLDKI